jgi:hypothetical protein
MILTGNHLALALRTRISNGRCCGLWLGQSGYPHSRAHSVVQRFDPRASDVECASLLALFNGMRCAAPTRFPKLSSGNFQHPTVPSSAALLRRVDITSSFMKTKTELKNRSWMQFKQPLALQASVLLLCLVALNSPAQTHTVTNCTEANLRAAMVGGGTVTFSCDGTILLANTITNVSDTALDASGRQVTISGNKAVRVFYVNTNVSFTLVNLTIADGTSLGGSAILNLGGTVNLTGVSFRSNTATLYVSNDDLSPQASGGAIFNRGGTVNAANCSFAGNTAQTPGALFPSPAWVPLVYGGAIRNEAGQVALRSCAFFGNRAAGGSVIYISGSDGDPGFGGAIHNSGTVTLDLCTFAGNSASGGTAPPYPQWAGFSGSEGSGGAIFNQGTLTADRTTLCGNTATGGSGLWGTGSRQHPGRLSRRCWRCGERRRDLQLGLVAGHA